MLRWMDGFEQYGDTESHMLEGVGGAAAWSTVAGWNISTANPATGLRHMRYVAAPSFYPSILRRPLGQSKQVSALGYRFTVTDLPASENLEGIGVGHHLTMAEFRDVVNNHQFWVNMGTEGSVHALGAGLDHRSDPCIAAGGYHHFECKGKVANSGGYVEIRVNEVTVLNVTGVDTQTTANAENSQFEFGSYTSVSGSVGCDMDVDDIFAWDDDTSDPENTVVDFVGDKGCYYLPVTADTAEADWALSTGATGYSLLDESPPSGTDYIDDTTGAARSIFEVGSLPANVAEVIAFMPVIYARKEESGTVNLRGGVVVGSDESYSPTNSPSTEYAYMEPGPKTINPDTGVAWDSSTVPDLLIERTA